MKRKEKEYLPLYWCRNMRRQLRDSINGDISAEELFSFVSDVTGYAKRENSSSALKVMYEFGEKYPDFADMMDSIAVMPDKKQSAYMWSEILKDFDSIANILMWAENKQCFQFDADFIEELIRTDDLSLNKNAWDFLPFQSFYVDISANKKLCEEIVGDGIFVTVEKVPTEYEWTVPEEGLLREEWYVHLCKVNRNYFFHDLMAFPNATIECDYPEEKAKVEVHDIVYDENRVTGVETRNIIVNKKMYQVLVTQILNYLSSTEPDICENEQTKVTYKPKPKNTNKSRTEDKFSEIRKWDVGIRFGTAVRKWRLSEKAMPDSSDTEDTGETTDRKQRKNYRVRPHTRKAHWSHYWYGSGDNKVRRPKWIAATFVNVGNNQEKTPVVIHKCS